MPQFLESILRGAAKARGFRSKKKVGQYVYGAMNNMGAMKGNQITPKGQAMEAKHTADVAKSSAAKSLQREPVKAAKPPRPAKFPDVHAYSWKRGFK